MAEAKLQALIEKQNVLVAQVLNMQKEIADLAKVIGTGDTSVKAMVRQVSPAFQNQAGALKEPLLDKAGQESPGHKRHSVRKDSATAQRHTMFPDPAQLRNQVIERLNKPQYNVEEYYKTTGIFQKWARASWFQNAAMVVILANTLWIAIDTDNNPADILSKADPPFIIGNNLFCFLFTFELTVRFLAFENKCNSLKDAWFVFDFLLVALMVWETWIEVIMFAFMDDGSSDSSGGGGGRATSILRIFRMLRLTRIARLARVLRKMPELMILIKGLLVALRSVGATLALLLLIVYVFAVAFTQQLAQAEWTEGMFKTVPTSMNTLLMFGVFPEGREFIQSMLKGGAGSYIFSILFLLMTSLTVLNMLIGVICEVVSVTAQVEKEELLLQDMKEKITRILNKVPDGGSADSLITKVELANLLNDDECVSLFNSVGVDPFALIDFVDFIFPREAVEVGKFIETVIKFRGTNSATVSDLVDTRMFLSKEIVELENRLMPGK